MGQGKRSQGGDPVAGDPAAFLRARAPWLLDPALGTCIVGSSALAEACRRAGIDPPATADLDLAWAPDVTRGEALLREHGVLQQTTTNNRDRGTLALKLDGRRIEITTFRAGPRDAPLDQRMDADLRARDMTVGALAWRLVDDVIFDPLGGLAHWRERRIVPTGDPAALIRTHPVRHVRYYRRAHEWGFTLDPSIRALSPDPDALQRIPPEALAAELRAALLRCRSPGRFLRDLHDAGLLAVVTPELAPQFDGRPAGPPRHHPEGSQAEHMVLVLEWAATHTASLPDEDRLAVAVAALCHDLGKNLTPESEWPSHHGHEEAGLPLVDALLARLPGLSDAATRRLAKAVCVLHLTVRRFDELRPGTKARLYERYFRQRDFRIDLFALAVGADVGGRAGKDADGLEVAGKVARDLEWLRERCASVDATALRAQHPDDDSFRAALHQARAAALRATAPEA